MNNKATKQLKSKLKDQQTKRKYKDIELPKRVSGERASITRVKGEKQTNSGLPTIKQVKKIEVFDDHVSDLRRMYTFAPLPGMPGFAAFSNKHKSKSKPVAQKVA